MVTTYNDRTGAIISRCGFYRYRLWRRRDFDRPALLWVMLNPSTADEQSNDPTLCSVIDISTRLGYGGVEVANLYAYRTKSPEVLKAAGYPIGAENDDYLRALAKQAPKVVCAWGANAQPARALAVREMLEEISQPMALKVNADGTPKHPLYVKRDTQLSSYWMLA